MKKNILRLFSALLLISMLMFSVTAAPVLVNPGIGSVYVPEKELGKVLEGEGTVENPYKINCAEEFFLASRMIESNNSEYGSDVYSIENCNVIGYFHMFP